MAVTQVDQGMSYRAVAGSLLCSVSTVTDAVRQECTRTAAKRDDWGHDFPQLLHGVQLLFGQSTGRQESPTRPVSPMQQEAS